MFDDDLEEQTTSFVSLYLLLFEFVKDLDYVSINGVFDEILIIFSRYYLHYVPTIKENSLLIYRQLEDS